MEMETIIKRHSTMVQYVQTSVLDLEGLREVQVKSALACFFIAARTASDPNKEDSTTVMNVTSVKNFSPGTTCIVQLLQTTAKVTVHRLRFHCTDWFDCSHW